MKKINFWKIIICLILQVICLHTYAQAPWSYSSPLDKRIYRQSYTNIKETTINPVEWGSSARGYNGLTILTTFRNPFVADKNKLITFYDKNNFKYMEISSEAQTLNIRRYHPDFPNKYYDYLLLDLMFDRPGDWDVRFYVTGFFLWVQAKVPNANQYYLTPIYFGLDYTDLARNNLNDLIEGVSNSKIVVGDSSAGDSFLIVDAVEVYAFQYSSLMSDIQNKFSWPDGTFISEDYYDETYDDLYD